LTFIENIYIVFKLIQTTKLRLVIFCHHYHGENDDVNIVDQHS